MDEPIMRAAYDHFNDTSPCTGDEVFFRAGWEARGVFDQAQRAFDAACRDFEERTGGNAGDMPLNLEDFLPPEWRLALGAM